MNEEGFKKFLGNEKSEKPLTLALPQLEKSKLF